MTQRLIIAAAVLVLACGSLAGAAAAAGPETPPAEPAAAATATFHVTVIHASRSAGGVDKALKDLERYLLKSFAQYASFKRLDDEQIQVSLGAPGTVALPDGKKLTLDLKGLGKGFIKVHLSLDGLQTTVNVKDGGLFFQAGRVHKDGILVLAIRGRSGASP